MDGCVTDHAGDAAGTEAAHANGVLASAGSGQLQRPFLRRPPRIAGTSTPRGGGCRGVVDMGRPRRLRRPRRGEGAAVFGSLRTQQQTGFLSVHHLLLAALMVGFGCSAAMAASFTTKVIGQSTPVPGADNRITVTLVADIALNATSAITISGLTGAVVQSPVTLLGAAAQTDVFSDGTTPGLGAWDSDALELTVSSGKTMAAGTAYVVGFSVTNPSSAQVSPTITVAASGSATIAAAVMEKNGTTLLGVANGADPLTVVVPTFSTKSVRQGTPVSGQSNEITVTLAANYDLIAHATTKVTISGLTGSGTADDAALNVTTCRLNSLGRT
ncbi:MAG: hypothetical protein ACPIOQ_76100, partial [Promethearchaeia archaeon]